MLGAGIDVISTVNIQHLESLNDAIAELTEVRVRETFPDRVLDDADEVVLVDLTPEALQERLRAGKVYPPDRVEVALDNFFRLDRLSALRELALREVAEDVGRAGRPCVLDPLSAQAVAERVLALVDAPSRGRSGSCAARGVRPNASARELDALWVRRTGRRADARTSRCSWRRCAGSRSSSARTSSKQEGDDLVATVRRVVAERGSTYVLVGTPDESRRREIVRGSLVAALVRELPGVDIRVDRQPGRPQERPVTAFWVAVAIVGAGVSGGATVCARRRRTPVLAGARSPFSCRSRGRSTRPCSTRRSGSRAPRRPCWSPAYLLVVPLQYPEDAPRKEQVARAMPLLEAVELAALRAGVPVDARIEKGRTLTHALRRLWEVEPFDRILAPAPGFTAKDLAWILTHAPAETIVLQPDSRKRASKAA